jgi:hypothetical protein
MTSGENSERNTASADQMTQSLTAAQIAREQSIVILSERVPNLRLSIVVKIESKAV